MKKTGVLVSLLVGTMFLASCGKSTKSTTSSPIDPSVITPTQPTKIEQSTSANHNVKSISLKSAEAFSLLAHSSITSLAVSSITGKVGVRPGNRSDLKITPEEISGGLTETYATDDKDTLSVNFVTLAKIDLINAYNDTETKIPDSDKVDLFGGALGNKILPAGIYKWNSRVTIPNDLTLQGSDTDVFIFQVAGDLRVGSDVSIKLIGGVQARNIYWQVGDNFLIKARSNFLGTIMAQGNVEIREQSHVEGRVFSKNGSISLDKATIVRPQ